MIMPTKVPTKMLEQGKKKLIMKGTTMLVAASPHEYEREICPIVLLSIPSEILSKKQTM